MDNKQKHRWEQIKKREFGKKHKCMYPGCTENSNYSHVFQRATILKQLCTDNQIRMFEFSPLFYEESPRYKLDGISNTFGFYGFCDYHDSKLFKPIEDNTTELTWSKRESWYLLSYRTVLCMLASARNAMNVYRSFDSEFPDEIRLSRPYELLNKQIELGEVYRQILENGIKNNDYTQLNFYYRVLDYRIEIANASCHYFDEPLYFGPIENKRFYICMIFPYESKTYIIIGYKDGYNGSDNWIETVKKYFTSELMPDNYLGVNEILISSGFHCMKPSYFDKIPKDTLNKFITDWKESNITV